MLTLVLAAATDQANPPDDSVVAGWAAFAVFLGLIAAVCLLGWSLTRQFAKARAAQQAGLYDESRPQRPRRED